MESKEYSEALNILSSLIKGVRRLDDKLLLMDIDFLESKLHFSLTNLPKTKASLMAARTAANAIYVPPAQQGTIDLQSGILHAEEKDYKTADDVAGIISSKAELQYVGPELDAMKALFETALRDIRAQQEEDPIVHRHLSSLLIEPFSRVEIAHIAELIELPVDHVEKKLSQMILGAGCLIIFYDPKTHAIYPATLETISNIGKVVDSLYVISAKIMA
ncbi:26S proteasome non-ATPase regulatory subunit 11 homolog [Fagus crenata]